MADGVWRSFISREPIMNMSMVVIEENKYVRNIKNFYDYNYSLAIACNIPESDQDERHMIGTGKLVRCLEVILSQRQLFGML